MRNAIFTCKIAAELILIAHFTNFILGTVLRVVQKREGRYMYMYTVHVCCSCRMLFFNIYYEPFVADDYLSTLRWIILSIIF